MLDENRVALPRRAVAASLAVGSRDNREGAPATEVIEVTVDIIDATVEATTIVIPAGKDLHVAVGLEGKGQKLSAGLARRYGDVGRAGGAAWGDCEKRDCRRKGEGGGRNKRAPDGQTRKMHDERRPPDRVLALNYAR